MYMYMYMYTCDVAAPIATRPTVISNKQTSIFLKTKHQNVNLCSSKAMRLHNVINDSSAKSGLNPVYVYEKFANASQGWLTGMTVTGSRHCCNSEPCRCPARTCSCRHTCSPSLKPEANSGCTKSDQHERISSGQATLCHTEFMYIYCRTCYY